MIIKKYTKSKIDSLNSDQLSLFKEMWSNNLLQICIPTGAGKGYLMMVDLLNQIVNTKNSIFAISSHRLMLNTQHLNDIFELLEPVIGEVGFVFVGSSKYDVNKFQSNTNINNALLKKKLSFNEIVSSTTIKEEVDRLVEVHIAAGRKVVILSTYHSLHTLANQSIDTIYNDEAHTLASDGSEDAKFKENFDKIKSKRCFFFTATPKDCVDDNVSFLMNNFKVFGNRVGLNFKECVEKGYIVTPVVHIAIPSNLNYDLEFKSIKNMAKFVEETFSAHRTFIKQSSASPEKISPKVLIKCPGVKEMWEIYSELLGKIPGVKICAGASSDYLGFNHFIDSEGINDRSKYLEKLQGFSDLDEAIILHFDTMSEGINIPGFTGVEFLGGKLPTISKTLQNTGRATRLHNEDRSRWIKNEIVVGDGKWIKPYCAVIIPFWDVESKATCEALARQIKGLRDNFEYDPIYYISVGSDLAKGDDKPEDLDGINPKDKKNRKFEIIDKINHEIEVLDKAQIAANNSKKYMEMTMKEWFHFANDIK